MLDAMHVAICCITFRRPEGLRRLLHGLNELTFGKIPQPKITVVVVDNDGTAPMRAWIDARRREFRWELRYDCEPIRGVSSARNRALDLVPPDADYIASIDDDEVPVPGWLDELLYVRQTYRASIVQGPVRPRFLSPPPRWLIRGRFLELGPYRDGASLHYGYTGNSLIDAAVVRQLRLRFDPRFDRTGGEDQRFFGCAIAAGHGVVTSEQALVHEWIPASRTTLLYLLRRRFRMGTTLAMIDRIEGGKGRLAMRALKGVARLSSRFGADRDGVVPGICRPGRGALHHSLGRRRPGRPARRNPSRIRHPARLCRRRLSSDSARRRAKVRWRHAEWAQKDAGHRRRGGLAPSWGAIDTAMAYEARIGLDRWTKHAVTAGFGRAIRWSGIGRRFFTGRTPIVFYHGVWPAGAPALARFGGADLDRLRSDLTVLAARLELVSLEELLHYNRDERTREKPPLAVCFDDGCDMIRSGAADVLDALGVPATMFVVTACIDNRHLMWMHKLQAIAVTRGADRLVLAYNRLMAETGAGPPIRARGELTAATWCWPMDRKEEYVDALYHACAMPPVEAYLDQYRPYMTWAELRAWRARGHTIGLHTRSHPFADRLAATEIMVEIITPAAGLRREFGIDFLPFAYPFGNRLAAACEARVAGQAGLACMLGVGGLSMRGTDPLRLDRVAGDDGLDHGLFGKPVLEAALQAAWPAARPRPALAVRHPPT